MMWMVRCPGLADHADKGWDLAFAIGPRLNEIQPGDAIREEGAVLQAVPTFTQRRGPECLHVVIVVTELHLHRSGTLRHRHRPLETHVSWPLTSPSGLLVEDPGWLISRVKIDGRNWKVKQPQVDA